MWGMWCNCNTLHHIVQYQGDEDDKTKVKMTVKLSLSLLCEAGVARGVVMIVIVDRMEGFEDSDDRIEVE